MGKRKEIGIVKGEQHRVIFTDGGKSRYEKETMCMCGDRLPDC